MSLFDLPTRADKQADNNIAKKISSPKKKSTPTLKGGGSLFERISNIRSLVETKLGKFKESSLIINTEEELHRYLDACIANNIISVDTETTGLNPLENELVGICIYTPNEKTAYIPVNHKSYITNLKVENQLPVDVLHNEFQRIADAGIDVIMFNAVFDMRFLKNGINVDLVCTWDCYLAARLLNENEPSNALKKLHQKYVLDDQEDEFRFDEYFSGITIDLIPISTAYLYAAHDAIITYELYEFQKPFLTADNEYCIGQGLQDVAWVFHNIEMPCLKVVEDLEETGIAFDFDYNAMLKEKYHKLLDERRAVFERVCEQYEADIDIYRKKTVNCKLETPINIDSPTQLAILLYDIMKCDEYYDRRAKQYKRSTNEEALKELDNDVTRAILGYREYSVIVGTFIDKLPECVHTDGRIHCKFNQYGADTGRFSSNNPNLQNIPSHNKEIRKMFKATDGYVLMSSDYSQQEPKCLAALCRKQGDSQMYNTFMQGKDLYSEIASKAFNKSYDECLEFNPDGTTNKEGKNRRTQAKSILLGINYGRGVESIAEQLGTTKEKAQAIKDSVFKGFPAIKKFEEDSIEMAKTVGYVTTVCGRKRRLPSMRLPDYEVKWKDGVAPDNDLLDFDSEAVTEVPLDIQRKWISRVRRVPFTQKRSVFEKANEEGLWIIDNTRSKDTTKVVNARIQGSAADLTKMAMIELYNSEELKKLGFRMLIPVHDEIIAECPEENAKECSRLLAETMSKAAEQILEMPIKCDVTVTKQWYGEELKL